VVDGLINIMIIVKTNKMIDELYYIPSVKINAKVADLVIPGNHINVEGYQYERLMRKPRGRSIKKNLKSMDGNTYIKIYS
jgi:hypothetical protein